MTTRLYLITPAALTSPDDLLQAVPRWWLDPAEAEREAAKMLDRTGAAFRVVPLFAYRDDQGVRVAALEAVTAAVEAMTVCFDHADACCSSWCMRCQEQERSQKRLHDTRAAVAT